MGLVDTREPIKNLGAPIGVSAKPKTMTVAELRALLDDEEKIDPSMKVCLLVGSKAWSVSGATGDENGNWLIVEAGVEIPFHED